MSACRSFPWTSAGLRPLQLRPAGSLSWRLLCPALLSDHNVAVDRSVSERHWAFLWRLRATGNAITPSPRDGGSYRVALQQYKSFWQDSTLDLCQAGRRRSFARQGLSDEASRSLVLVGVCGDDSALWGYGRKPPLTHILPHYHVTWRIPAAPPLGDAFDLAARLRSCGPWGGAEWGLGHGARTPKGQGEET